ATVVNLTGGGRGAVVDKRPLASARISEKLRVRARNVVVRPVVRKCSVPRGRVVKERDGTGPCPISQARSRARVIDKRPSAGGGGINKRYPCRGGIKVSEPGAIVGEDCRGAGSRVTRKAELPVAIVGAI